MRDYQLVSADSHLEAPPVWAEMLPKDLRDRGPRIIQLEDGDGIQLNTETIPITGLALTAGQRYSEIRQRGRRFKEEPGAGSSPQQRVEEQDRDNLDAETLFPAVASVLNRIEDPLLVRESARAYNNWLSEYCSYAPDRLFGLAVIPFTGIDDATEELRRVAGKGGIRGAWLLRFPSGCPMASPEDEPFWATAEELGITITAHHNFGGQDFTRGVLPGGSDLQQFSILMTSDLTVPALPIVTILQLMLTGVLDRHPNLRFLFAETHIGWIPFWLEHMEDIYDRHHFWPDVDLPRRPSQYIRDQFAFSFMEDHVGISLRHLTGVDNICWASDFPHSVSDWPWSQETAARQFRGLPDYERRKIQALNIVEWLRVITPTEKESLAREPVIDKAPAELLPRGARRL